MKVWVWIYALQRGWGEREKKISFCNNNESVQISVACIRIHVVREVRNGGDGQINVLHDIESGEVLHENG